MAFVEPEAEAVALRQSAIAAASCLKRYHTIYVAGVDDDSDETRRGSAFHTIALDYYIPALVEAGCDTDYDLLGRAFEAGAVAERLPSHLYDEVEEIVFKWGEAFTLDRRALLAVEERRAAYGASGRMDLVYAWRNTPKGSVLRVTDFKTYRAILNADAVRRSFQAKLYMKIAMLTWPGFDVYEFAMAFPRYGTAETVVEFEPAELDSLERQVATRLATIDAAAAAEDWPAQPGEHCGICRLRCDVADDPRVRARRILDPIEATVVAGRALVGSAQIKADIAALKQWCMTEGPVTFSGMEYAHRPATRNRWSVEDVIAICRENKVTAPLFETGKSGISKLLTKTARRAFPKLADALDAAAAARTVTTFGAKRVGTVDTDDDEAE